MDGDVVEEADLQADGDDLAEFGRQAQMLTAGAELGEGHVAGACEFDSGGDDGGVEVEDREQLDLDAELHVGGGEGLALEHPAAAIAEGRRQVGKQAVALFVGEALDVERMHGFDEPPRLGGDCRYYVHRSHGPGA